MSRNRWARIARQVQQKFKVTTALALQSCRDVYGAPDFEKRMAFWRQRALRDAYFDKSVKASIGEEAARAIYEDKVKLLLNLVALGVAALPRGGEVNVEIAGTPEQVAITIRAKGDAARLEEMAMQLLSGANGASLDARSIQPYYTNRVAGAAGMKLTVEIRDSEVELKAT